MKKLLLLAFISLLFTSCMSSNFTQTGQIYDPLPELYPVKVVLSEQHDVAEFIEIGALQVIQEDMNNLSKAIEHAKTEARLRGGDVIFLISTDSNSSVSGNQFGIYSSESNSFIFVIGKLL